MKIKITNIWLSVIAITFVFQSCTQKTKESKMQSCCALSEKIESKDSILENAGIRVYYFHAVRRCATCLAVEKITKEFIENNYSKNVEFITVNRDDAENEELIGKYEVSGQTLLIVGREVENLTNQAFLNAKTNPQKLKDILRKTIEKQLN